jgi:hypothetical protein
MPVCLAADGQQSVRFLAVLLREVPKADIKLLVMGPGPAGTPPAGAIDLADQLSKVTTSADAARIFSRDLKDRFESCPPLAERFRQITEIPEDERPEFLAASIRDGLRECQCGSVDLDALEYAALRVLNWKNEEFRVIDIPRDHQGNLTFPSDPTVTIGDWIRQL